MHFTLFLSSHFLSKKISIRVIINVLSYILFVDTMSELLMVSIGGSGVRIGQKAWEIMSEEHNIDPSGHKTDGKEHIYNDSTLFE